MNIIKHSGVYIGRTDEYYNDDDDYVFVPDFWTEGSDKDSSDFAKEGPVYELNDEGRELLNKFRRARNFNQYQAERASKEMRELYYTSWNGMWEELAKLVVPEDEDIPEDAVHVTVWSPDENYWETADDGRRYTFHETQYQAAYEAACDCLYYGEGCKEWKKSNEHLSSEMRDMIWSMAHEALADDYRY